MFQLLWAVIVGAIVGAVARALLLGADQMGLLATIAVGIAGSIIGGFIGRLVKKPAEGKKFSRAGFLMSVVGAIILLLIIRQLR